MKMKRSVGNEFGKGLALLLLFAMLTAVFCACSGNKAERKRIGILSGSIFDEIADEFFPDCERVYYQYPSELADALENGKIDGYIHDDPMARKSCAQYKNQEITMRLADDRYGFVFNKGDSELCEKMSAMLRTLREDGTLELLKQIWLGGNESLHTVDMSGLTGENGTIRLAVSHNVPFSYEKDGACVGLEIDLIARFCREYGYAFSFEWLDLTEVFAKIESGEADIGAASISITEERKETLLFSESYYDGGVVFVEKTEGEGKAIYSLSDLDGKAVGVQSDSEAIASIRKYLPTSTVNYYSAIGDMAEALEKSEIFGYVADEALVRLIGTQYPTQKAITTLSKNAYAFAFPKEGTQGNALRTLFNGFLEEALQDGTLDEIDGIWFGSDESKKKVDYSGLTPENGTLTLAVSSSSAAPFLYKNGAEFAGYDIDLAVRFCKKYGYGLIIADYSLGDLFTVIKNGGCDMAASCIAVTEERKADMLFSDTVYTGGSVLVVKNYRADADGKIHSIDDLAGKTICVQTGSIMDQIAAKMMSSCPISYFDLASDCTVALDTGKADAYLADEPVARLIVREYENLRILTSLSMESYAFAFPKSKPGSEALRKKVSSFILECKQDGTLKEIDEIWFGDDESKQVVDMSGLTGENGKLTMAVLTVTGAPFCYVKDEKIVGYDIDIAVRFCRKYGYALELADYGISGLISAVSGGKCDMAASCLAVTEERKETMLFSEPDYEGGIVVIVRDSESENGGDGFFGSVVESFKKTFLRENRWRLFLSGIGNTLLIALLSIALGTLLGFLLYFIYSVARGGVRVVMDTVVNTVEKTPVVVILMILYYLIFGSAEISGIWVSVIGFTLLFGGSVLGLLKMGVSAIDIGQREAALALGYSGSRAFLLIILPQALRIVLPGYKSAVVSLIKDTAIVGYIAVQDLTKVSDIVRSRTYEAFFPLIATAVMYFLIAQLLIMLIRRIEINADPKKRSPEKILKGVVTK